MNRVSVLMSDGTNVFVDMDEKHETHVVSGPHQAEEILKSLQFLAQATIELMRLTDNELDKMMGEDGPPKCVVVLEPEELIALMWAVEAVKGKHDPVVMAHSRAAYGVLVEQHQRWLKMTESNGDDIRH